MTLPLKPETADTDTVQEPLVDPWLTLLLLGEADSVKLALVLIVTADAPYLPEAESVALTVSDPPEDGAV